MLHNIKLVILDRDGVINHDSPFYIKSPEEWVAIEGSLEAIGKLNRAGIKVAIATNQSGIGRGYYDLETLSNIHHKMIQGLEAYQAHIDLIEFCPHHPEVECECRKPKPGMLIKICHRLKMPISEAVMIGDSQRDIEAAEVLGMRSIWIGKDYQNLQDAVHALLSK